MLLFIFIVVTLIMLKYQKQNHIFNNHCFCYVY